jgi:hypothetical protein
MSNYTGNYLRGIWGSSGTDVFVVGGWGSSTILHYDGTSWYPMDTGTAFTPFAGIWGSSGTDVFAVGMDGYIFHYDGTSWSFSGSDPETDDLYSVWGSSGTDVYVGGDDSSTLHYDGTNWSPVDIGYPQDIEGIWGSSEKDVFIVAGGGTILHCGEATFVDLFSLKALPLNRRVLIRWVTKSETGNKGFNLYQAESEDSQYVKLNPSLITAKGTSTRGAIYRYVDKDVRNRTTYWYKLEDIDIYGQSTVHGPVKATPRRIGREQ